MAVNTITDAVQINRALLVHLLDQPVFCCPLSGFVLVDPVILAASGLSYDRAAITAHLEAHGTDPVSGAALSARDRRLFPNPALRSLIAGMVQSVDPSLEITAEIGGPSEEPVIE